LGVVCSAQADDGEVELAAPVIKGGGGGGSKGEPSVKKEKKDRKPTAYNIFMAKHLPQYKADHPDSNHKDNFAAVAAKWKNDPENPKNGGPPSGAAAAAAAAAAPSPSPSPPADVASSSAEEMPSLAGSMESLLPPQKKKKKKKKKSARPRRRRHLPFFLPSRAACMLVGKRVCPAPRALPVLRLMADHIMRVWHAEQRRSIKSDRAATRRTGPLLRHVASSTYDLSRRIASARTFMTDNRGDG
jgi:hypothetical protein